MDGLAARLPARARPALVRASAFPVLSAAGLLLVVVRLRRLRARRSSSRAPISPRRAGSSPRPSPSACRSGAPAKRRMPRPTAPPAGRNRRRSRPPACSDPMASCSAATSAAISATTARSMCCASRRPDRGKGVGLVIPSLLTWPGSAIVHDIKGENWQLTAGFRAQHGRVLLFDPTNAKSSAYNPLLEVRRGEWEVRDVQNIADILVDPEGSLEKRNHWEKTSHALLVGAILHVLYAEEDKTLAGVASFLSDPKRPIESTLSAMMRTPHLGEAGVHPVVASAARELLNKSGNERSGVLEHGHVVPRPLSRSRGRRGDAALRLADRRHRRRRAAHHALPRRAAVRHQPHQAADPPDPQPDRPAADRGPAGQGRPTPAPPDARRVPGARSPRLLRVARSPSWRATASRASSSPSR